MKTRKAREYRRFERSRLRVGGLRSVRSVVDLAFPRRRRIRGRRSRICEPDVFRGNASVVSGPCGASGSSLPRPILEVFAPKSLTRFWGVLLSGPPVRPENSPPAPRANPLLRSLPGPITLPQIPRQSREDRWALDCISLRGIDDVRE